MATATVSELQPGVAVALHGLNAAELNGKGGTCESWDATKGRWNVRLYGGEFKALKAENLQPIGKLESFAARGKVLAPWIVGVVGILSAVMVLQQSGVFSSMGVPTPISYVQELFEPFEAPPPKAPEDTVVISFCQG